MLSPKQIQAIHSLDLDPEINEVFFGGAAGGGKSFLGCFWQIVRRLYNPGTRGFMGRNSYMEFKTFTFKTFWHVWNEYFQNNPMKVTINYNSQDKTVYFSNGSEILVKDLSYNSNDPEFNNLGGMELTDAFIDEVPGITKKAKDVVWSRIRHKLINNKPIMLMTGNPTNNWVKTEFVSDKQNNSIELPKFKMFIAATLYDNPNPEFVATYRQTLEKLPLYDRMRLLEGDWSAQEKPENPFAYEFNPDKHVKPCTYNPELPVFISIDFNINPFCAGLAHHTATSIRQFSEIEAEHGSIDKLCDKIRSYGIPRGMIRITGDAMGKRGDISQRDNATLYMQIKKNLQLSDNQFQLVGNPTHENSRSQVNAALLQLDIGIDPSCTGTIRDLQLVSCNERGEIIKSNRKQENQRADHLDHFRYRINTYFRSKIFTQR
jgi:hypothetical protein